MSDVWINGDCWDSEDILEMERELNQEKQRREDAEKALEFYLDDGSGYDISFADSWTENIDRLYEDEGARARTHFEKYKND